ncbi:MAG: dTMP kinase [Frankiales bacterium]|jgi:dTMP kinase|nr:dTMP kinase [Frankiales bacterium]MDX6246084.1 dTMP kinase [Frankiales bacterium]
MPREATVPNPGDVSGATVPSHQLSEALAIPAFRKLWIALGLSSLGDWLGLLAATAFAASLVHGYRGSLFATGAVLASRLAPAVLFGPFAGAFADRFDRRKQMVLCDLIRACLVTSIILVHSLPYLLAASFAIEIFSLFWIPAKEASVPNLVPRRSLEAANQISLVTTYGMALVAAVLFSLLSVLTRALTTPRSYFTDEPIMLAFGFDAATFLISAATIYSLREISEHGGVRGRDDDVEVLQVSIARAIINGWKFVGTTPMVRGLVVGILGAFAAGGAVVGVGRQFAADLNGGDAAYGVLFGAVFAGLALGMLLGPRLLRQLSARRKFGMSIVGAGVTLSVDAVLPNLVIAVAVTTIVGFFAGLAWVTGYTLLGGEVPDDIRGRTFSLVQSLVQVDLLLTLSMAPVIAAFIGNHHLSVWHTGAIRYDGVTVLLFVAGLVAVGVGVAAFKQMDDRRGVSVRADLWAALRGERRGRPRVGSGLFVAFEGGEGAGKSTQVQLLAQWLTSLGHEVVTTHEPGGTPVGARLRALLLDRDTTGLSPRAEALLYAADRAAHVDSVVLPALMRGAVVVTDRYIDSSVAYQGAGRVLPAIEVRELSEWATDGLLPQLTVLLDIDPAIGLRRFSEPADRIESESLEFHRRVRAGFLGIAAQRPDRYLVLDATLPMDQVFSAIQHRVVGLLPTTAAVPAVPLAGVMEER